MQGGRGGPGGSDPFSNFGGSFGFVGSFGGFGGGFGNFGGQRSLLSGFLGGRDPFDDPFFTRPFGGMFESSIFGPPIGSPFMNAHPSGFLEHRQPQQSNRSRGPIIEELNSDDEKEEDKGEEERKGKSRKHARSGKEPFVECPDDEPQERRSKQMQYANDMSRVNNTQSLPQGHSFSFQSSSVTYGGANGAYYTSSRTRRAGSNGLTFEEDREANSATGQASHKIARGIHDKGHSVKRELKSDGRVDTMQTLHNLEEDELPVFEQAWIGKAGNHLPALGEINGINGSGSGIQQSHPNRGGWALPSTEHPQHQTNIKLPIGEKANSSHSQNPGKMKTNVHDQTGPSLHRSRAPTGKNMDQARRR